MKYTIIQINRNIEAKCVCGSTCEKISFEVADDLGTVNTYGSSCIKSVLGINTKHLELKRGVNTLKLNVVKVFENNNSHQALFKQLKECDTSDINNIGYKVVAKWVIVDDFTGLEELNNDNTINYNYKVNKAQYKLDSKIQDLKVGSIVYQKDLDIYKQ